MKSFSIRKEGVAISWYFFFGLVHEIAHLLTAWLLGASHKAESRSPVFFQLLQALIGRACFIQPTAEIDTSSFQLVRHAGWISSLMIACLLQTQCSKFSLPCRKAAWVTFFEALCTDLLGLGGIATPTAGYLFCGNFGIVFMNSNWLDEKGGQKALDMLQKMIKITMIRGAQSGGILAWNCSSEHAKASRSRVVNGKRTDLSNLMMRCLKGNVSSLGRLRRGIFSFYGHTRFATSSKTTLDGAHPHRWTPPQRRRIISLSSVFADEEGFAILRVENYITHNGDFDFYVLNDVTYDLETVQQWLVRATGAPMPSRVDSAAIAGMIDILRTAGCFGLSIRYAVLLGCRTSKMGKDMILPAYHEYEEMGMHFEQELKELCYDLGVDVPEVKRSTDLRRKLVLAVVARIREHYLATVNNTLTNMIEHDEEQGDEPPLYEVVQATVNAFFSNSLLRATQIFMKHAKGSFGLVVTSSLDAHRQVCLAARGQPMSIAFYPKKGLFCYASEAAAVKAGMNIHIKCDQGDRLVFNGSSAPSVAATETSRLDLDDLGGEIILLDWGRANGDVLLRDNSFIGRSRTQFLSEGELDITIYQESRTANSNVKKRLLPLEDNEFIQPLPSDTLDPVGADIHHIPAACKAIQDSWASQGLNRHTAWHLVRCLKHRLLARIQGSLHSRADAVDVLLTGCEVSLWLAEQFATDLQKSFPKLNAKAVSSNKLLGIFGQELSMPAVGYPMSETYPDLNGAIVIIVSHSGQTFAPLACSSLLQSFTCNIFVIASEWDCQIGKQLRAMYKDDDDILSSRIFTTGLGLRPAEPCSVSVAATQQLLTNIFMHISISLLSDHKLREAGRATITENDLQILARCNENYVATLESIVGTTIDGRRIAGGGEVETKLRKIGDVWSEHILENVKAYVLLFVYILVTVTSGYPLISSIATLCGLQSEWAFYIARFFDSLLYFFFHQLCIFAIRIVQGRSLAHRTASRTVVIGDIPWVAQAADALLSKLFAVAYPLATINVLSGNPADHLVHRFTHRVVRGTLLVCGRPDGRLAALNAADTSVCLSVYQASSISGLFGGTCESVTIGHNAATLSLTSSRNIVLPTSRPQFLCERVLDAMDEEHSRKLLAIEDRPSRTRKSTQSTEPGGIRSWHGDIGGLSSKRSVSSRAMPLDERNETEGTKHVRSLGSLKFDNTFGSTSSSALSLRDSHGNKNNTGRALPLRSTQSIKAIYLSLTRSSILGDSGGVASDEGFRVQEVVREMIKEQQDRGLLRNLFRELDKEGTGFVDVDDFVNFYLGSQKRGLTEDQIRQVLHEEGLGKSGKLDEDGFKRICNMESVDILKKLQLAPRDDKGFLQVHASQEAFFGQSLQTSSVSSIGDFAMSRSQHFAMELYESRIASLERFVAMCVMFHQMGYRVQNFFDKYSFGLLGYRMDRTHSIMRVATTASPVSGSEVRERMETLALRSRIQNSIRVIGAAWRRYHHHQQQQQQTKQENNSTKETMNRRASSVDSEEQGSGITLSLIPPPSNSQEGDLRVRLEL